MPFDGAGIVDLEVAKIWSKELNDILRKETNRNKVNYIPSSFQFRAIIGVKGTYIH
ncbi:hypothetical protein IS491_23505 [Clostridium beijerinckii]|uniref:Uncharacterized protein n=1 Tax=Clostridium beijerinckii TaxID=1520 RepID=A0AAE2RTX9_CLOBE|nr:hypothetical protein [Clostridium beijerinckii]MBF7811558.1 hypothetical protein [Clostridium beijerinckii]